MIECRFISEEFVGVVISSCFGFFLFFFILIESNKAAFSVRSRKKKNDRVRASWNWQVQFPASLFLVVKFVFLTQFDPSKCLHYLVMEEEYDWIGTSNIFFPCKIKDMHANSYIRHDVWCVQASNQMFVWTIYKLTWEAATTTTTLGLVYIWSKCRCRCLNHRGFRTFRLKCVKVTRLHETWQTTASIRDQIHFR